MAQIRRLRLRYRIEVDVDDLVQIASHDLGHFVQLLEIKGLLLLVDETIQSDRGQIADSHLIRTSILDDLGTKIGALDGSQILLIRLSIAGILVEHVRETGLTLR